MGIIHDNLYNIYRLCYLPLTAKCKNVSSERCNLCGPDIKSLGVDNQGIIENVCIIGERYIIFGGVELGVRPPL